ncbi:MAG: hypothetical protein HQ481_18360 [Alphaproteobacteria bacterium]|nr:hypothetical protein [Alphaproteobacteria bacterium]
MLWIERVLAAMANFIAIDLMKLDSTDVERARAREFGDQLSPDAIERPGGDNRQVVVRFGR